MDTVLYDTLRHFADSWGLVYMFAVFLAVAVFLFRPGAKAHAQSAAQIPLHDNYPAQEDDRS
ncbi:MAG: cbb3-type cytochrome c oxidase subunit 3 [Devosia sp.]|nr:cbb3-type cytochrome c oxidase subunit 3 [Devosia sp.]